MATFTVNGQTVQAEKNQKLIRFLRDELRLTSVKDGCSEGACGTCHVLIDGKATKACVPSTDKLEGKTILTVEGLSDWEKDVYTYAFGKAGAVQCGFCIPGMVISAKALLDANPAPTREEAAFAIRNNICRCTGYVKIIDGILLAAEIFRSGKLPEEKKTGYGVGERAVRVDVAEKVQGYGKYPDDLYVDGMLYAGAVRSKYPRARVLAIHKEKAEALPGVVGVYTAEDIPGEIKVGHLQQDWDAMIPVGRITHYLGDAICLVAAETKEALEQAKALVEIDYEPLKPVFSPTYASQPFAPLVHESGNLLCEKHVSRGNADQAIRDADYVLMYHYETPYTEHAFLEPECAVAYPDEDGLTILSTDQGAYDTAREVSRLLGLPKEKIHVTNMLVGGGFGGKEDMSVQHHAALVAYLTGRPVKVKLSRKESMLVHPKRHPMKVTITMGCNRDGLIQGVKAEVVADTGAYASLGGPVLERACTHAVGPYKYQNTDIRGFGYYPNNPPAGAYRGFGVCQSEFALESLIDLLAEKAGLDPWEIRYQNAIEPGEVLPNGQIADCSTALKETLLEVKDAYYAHPGHAGIACAMKNAGVGVGLPDAGRCKIRIEDGVAVVYAATSDIGQGCNTVFLQDVAEACGLPLRCIANGECSTENAPDSGTTSGSRQTVVTGEAVRGAAFLLRDAMLDIEAGKSAPAAPVNAHGDGVKIEYDDGRAYQLHTQELVAGQGMHPQDPAAAIKALEGCEFGYVYLEPTDKLGADVPNPKSHICYGFATHVVILDDDGRVSEVYAAHDSGKVVNPISIQGQIEGGVLMGMGYALTEDWPLKDCVPQARYGTLGLFRAPEIPDIHAIYVEKDELLPVAYGGKGIGEIATIPTAPAVQNAYRAFDGKLRPDLPMVDTPYSRARHRG